ncbi:MAG TPA: hypothetical protein VFI76_07945 [Terrimicrobiaceae bacterium]|nr:hypothetical protein [Terrimicrobiaceae bacterium]
MKHTHSVAAWILLLAGAALTCLTGCISVTREVEPTATVTTTETRSSTLAPATTTTVERTAY